MCLTYICFIMQYRMVFPTKWPPDVATVLPKNVHFSDIDRHYYIISGHKLRKYFNVLQHEQNKFMLCKKKQTIQTVEV